MIGNPAKSSPKDLVGAAATGILAALLIAALYFGSPLLVPFALAVLLAFVLARPVRWLQKLGLPQTAAVIGTVAVSVALIAALAVFIGIQVGSLAAQLPHYQRNLTTKIESVRGATTGNKIVASGSRLVQNLDDAITKPDKSRYRRQPVPVEIRPNGFAPFQTIGTILDPLLQPLATLAIVIIFVVFILLGQDDLRNRFISLIGSRDIQRASLAMDEGARRLSSYLMLQTIVNASIGMAIGTGLWLIGVPNPSLWGLIVAIFRYVPYVGVPAAAAVPLALALAVDPGWTKVAMTGGLYLGVEAIAGNAVEPYLYGRNMGLSPIAVLLSAAFWTFVWGPVGLLLSTPLTMCLVVIGRHVEHLHFLDVLLGDRPALSDEEQFYLTVSKGDPDELTRQADLQMRHTTLADYADRVVVRGLALAQLDLNRGSGISVEDSERILACMEGFIENLADDHDPDEETVVGLGTDSVRLPPSWQERPVLCVADRGPLNRAVARLLQELLRRHGIEMQIISAEESYHAALEFLSGQSARVVCLSYLEPGDPASARYLVRRLRKRIPHAPIIAGFWSATQNDTQVLDWIEATGADIVACNLSTAVQEIVQLAQQQATAPTVADEAPDPIEEGPSPAPIPAPLPSS